VPITPTYPGVYIEELPSTVHTIVGVSTSVTAFVGYTKRGPADQPTHIFSFGDFQRAFGGLDPDSPLTYAVQQFFLNGGSEAWIVRVAVNADNATVTVQNMAEDTDVLILEASSSGTWANTLRIAVDYGTTNPESLFNLTVTEYVVSGGQLVPGNSESFLNLTLNSFAPTYAVDVINANSKLLTAERPAGFPANPGAGTSEGLTEIVEATPVPAGSQLVVSLDGDSPVTAIFANSATGSTNVKNELQNALTAAGIAPADLAVSLVGAAGHRRMKLTSGRTDERSSVHVFSAPDHDLATTLGLGVQNGGDEVDGVADLRPAPTGTLGKLLDDSLGGALPAALDASGGDLTITATVTTKAGATALANPVVLLAQNATYDTKEDLRKGLQAALQAVALDNPGVAGELAGTRVALVADQFVITGGGRPDTTISIAGAAGTPAAKIGFGANQVLENVASYSPSTADTTPIHAQHAAALGSDGTPPAIDTDVIGDPAQQTGIYALDHVDLFNLLVLPDSIVVTTSGLSAAMTYCELRRAFFITDLPGNVSSLSGATDWISSTSTPKSANAAAYFPRLDFPDPMQGNRARPMPSAGAIAGLYARMDASRGVWKAPAGTEAVLRGPSGVDVQLNDAEQGTLNPLGLNVTRALPVYGNVVWGARTLYGADQLGNQWKYIPVRRVALYIEESLFRGTKWAVFEPNDEPLWAQLRLSVGTFMHNLFRQHAFEGASPRQAYLVKCDSETTTQADIDLGIVNIIVGFAPLKPAEFVVIQITQLAGQLDV
jgi:uncharacterized protein